MPLLAYANEQSDYLGGLRAGQIVTTGSLCGVLPVRAAGLLQAHLDKLGQVWGRGSVPSPTGLLIRRAASARVPMVAHAELGESCGPPKSKFAEGLRPPANASTASLIIQRENSDEQLALKVASNPRRGRPAQRLAAFW